jgi:hypothetical protein
MTAPIGASWTDRSGCEGCRLELKPNGSDKPCSPLALHQLWRVLVYQGLQKIAAGQAAWRRQFRIALYIACKEFNSGEAIHVGKVKDCSGDAPGRG